MIKTKKTFIVLGILTIISLVGLAVYFNINKQDNSNAYIKSSETSAPINIIFIDSQKISEQNWDKYFSELKDLQIKTVVFKEFRKQNDDTCDFQWLGGDTKLYDADKARIASLINSGIKVYLGGSTTSPKCTNTNEKIITEAKFLRELLKKDINFNSENIKGWYINKTNAKTDSEILAALITGTNKKSLTTINLLSVTKDNEIEKVYELINYIDESTVNNIYVFDSSGLDCSINKDSTIAIDFYTNAFKLMGKNVLGAIVDTTSCGISDQNISASFSRIRPQIYNILKIGIENIGILNPQLNMSSISSNKNETSEYLFDSYKSYYLQNTDEKILQNFSYSFDPITKGKYEKRNGDEMRNKYVPSPMIFDDRMWTGFDNNLKIKISLQKPEKIKWIGIDVMSDLNNNIGIPNKITTTCLDNNETLSSRDYTNIPNTESPFEINLLNINAINKSCQNFEIEILNTKQTLLGEVEVIVYK